MPKLHFRRSCCRAFGRRSPWSSLISLRKPSGNYPATIRPLSGQNHVFPLYSHRLETLTYQTLLFYCIYNGFGNWGSLYQPFLLYLQWFPNLEVSKLNFSIVSKMNSRSCRLKIKRPPNESPNDPPWIPQGANEKKITIRRTSQTPIFKFDV